MSKPAEDLWLWLKTQFGDKAALLVVFAAFLFVGLGWARTQTREAAAEQMDPIRIEQERQRRVMERYEEDVHGFRQDIRELYKSIPFTRSSPTLERPAPAHDGGE